MKSYEFSAKTVEKAIKEGLATLGKNQEDVDIKILSEGGFLKKAKVVINAEEENGATNFVEQSVETNVEQPAEQKVEKTEAVAVDKPISQVVETPVVEKQAVETEVAIQSNEPEIKVEKQEETQQAEKSPAHYVTQISPEEKEKRFEERHFENNTGSVEFVTKLVNLMGMNDAKISLQEMKDSSNLSIATDNAGKIIGYRGESLYAIQYIANVVEQKTNKNAKRVVVDAGDYRQKREQELRNLAIRVAGKVEESGRPYKLDPMGAYERRIVHTELQNYSVIETHSEGVEPYRHIVVTKK